MSHLKLFSPTKLAIPLYLVVLYILEYFSLKYYSVYAMFYIHFTISLLPTEYIFECNNAINYWPEERKELGKRKRKAPTSCKHTINPPLCLSLPVLFF